VYLVVDSSPASGTHWGVIAGLGAAVLYAFYWHLGRSLRPALSETMVTISQSALIALTVLPFLPFASRPPIHLADWGWLVWFGAINTALASQLYLYALRHLSASSCGAFVAIEPVYAITFAALIFRDPLSLRTLVSGVVILTASYLLSRVESDPAISPNGAPDGHEI
jgi:drug/metabolite transporter (DMT)-like permease